MICASGLFSNSLRVDSSKLVLHNAREGTGSVRRVLKPVPRKPVHDILVSCILVLALGAPCFLAPGLVRGMSGCTYMADNKRLDVDGQVDELQARHTVELSV